ncbi:MAG: tetratricopeptide repeat protein [Rubripirellula sp.]
MPTNSWPNFVSAGLLFVCLVPSLSAADPNEKAPAKNSPPAITSLPEIDPAIHAAMQSRSYLDAVKLIQAAIDDAESPDYLRYLQGVALTEAKQYDNALAAFAELEQEHPESQWLSRSRFGRANVHVARRDYIQAGEIYEQEAERLLSRGRKDTLAKIYLEFADRYFDGTPADDPSKALQPDFTQALTYYSEAAKLRPTRQVQQRIAFRIARCHEELKSYPEAIAAYESFLDETEHEQDNIDAASTQKIEARFRLGSVQLAAGQPVKARKIWQDLEADRNDPNRKTNDTIESFFSRAEYRLAHTYGLPAPRTIADLERAVGLVERFLNHHPGHELAPLAELEVAQGYSRHGRHIQAIERLQSLIDNPAYADSKQLPIAQRMLGMEFLAQGEFDQAITAWKDFLDQHPTDPNWPKVQKRIVDTEYAKASDAKKNKQFADARTSWQTFLNKYPLDVRAPGILLQFGQMKITEAAELHAKAVETALEKGESAQSVVVNESCRKLFEEAIVDLRRVVSKYPARNEASSAAFQIGVILEDRLGKLKEALDSYQQVKGQYSGQAAKRITRLTAPQLQVVTERKFRSDEKPRIKLTTRNLGKVMVKAYRVDMTDYFRKMHLASGVETLDIALIDPDQQFEHEIDGYQQYQQIDGDIELPINQPGVTAVTVSSEKLEATTMVVVSDLDMIVKTSRNELFLFAQNMREGKPVSGVSVLISDGSKVFAEEVTGDDGILQKSYDELVSVKDLRVFAIHEGQVASTVNDLNGLDFAVGLAPRGYLYTDRPAYRRGQLVNVKAIVRWVDQDRFTFQAGEKFDLDVYDSRGRQVFTKQVALNAYGTINANVLLADSAPQGNYRVHLHRRGGDLDKPGKLSFETSFQVNEYKLEPIDVTIDLEKDVYFRGDKVSGSIDVKYYYGTPLANETVVYQFGPNAEKLSAKTDETGKVEVEFETQQFHESGPVTLLVEYPDRGLKSARTIYLATRGFAVTASSIRNVYLSGESFETLFKVADPAGDAVGTKLKIEVFRHTRNAGQQGQELIETQEAASDNETGETRQSLTLDDAGTYSIRATGTDQFGNQVSGENRIVISGDKDATRLRILADQHSFEVGDQAEFNLHWREKPALALVTYEGSTVLAHELIELKQGDNTLQVPMQSDFAPNVFVSVAVMQRNQFHHAGTEFRVVQELKVTVKPNLAEVKPGDDLTVQIEVTDPQGKPVSAELSLALVQTNLLNRFEDVQGLVSAFFSQGKRRASVRQATSCTFSYHPQTKGVSQFLLVEADRRKTLEREVRALAQLGDFAFDDRSDTSGDPFDDSADGAEVGVDFDLRLNDLGVTPQAGALYQTEQRTRNVPIVRYRTELRGGTQVQVPYTEQTTHSYSDQVSSSGLMRPNFMDDEAGQMGMSSSWMALNETGGVGGGAFGSPGAQSLNYSGAARTSTSDGGVMLGSAVNESWGVQRRSFGRDATINGITKSGQFLAIKVNDEDDLESLGRESGIRVLPMMSHAETAFWDPTIVTDAATGRATVTITMPQRSTSWRLRAKGIDGAVLAGQASADVITKKDLFGEMKLPLAFTVGDKASVPVEIHNSLEGARSLKVQLKVTLGDKTVAQTKIIDVTGPGVEDLSFPIQVEDADRAQLELTIVSESEDEPIQDTSSQIVDVRPFGFPVYETASGSSAQSTVAMIQFPIDSPVQGRSLEILIGADVNRSLLESVLGTNIDSLLRCGLPSASSIERSVSDVLGGIELLSMIGDARDAETPETLGLTGRITSKVSQLIAAQHEGGGWTWTGMPTSGDPDASLSARVMWALSAARDAGFSVPADSFDRGKVFLRSSFAALDQSDLERQTIVLHGMAISGCGDFAFANRLYRERNRLTACGLIHLALTMDALKHTEMASELIAMPIEVPLDRNKITSANRERTLPWMRNTVELQAMYLLALQQVNSNHPNVAKLAKSLMASRIGSRWPVEKANGPAIVALARWHARDRHVSGKYRLTIWVNDREVETLTIDPATDGSRRIQIPSEHLYGTTGVNAGQPQRVEFKLDGRATFSYSAVLTGFVAAEKIKASTRDWSVSRRYEPAQRTVDGRTVPRGFSVVNGSYQSFTNSLTQLPVGQRGEVTLSPRRHATSARLAGKYDYLVLTEPIPAGCTVLEDSITGKFERYEIEPGQITFYLGDQRYPGDIRYTLVGYVPGDFRVPQSILRSFYEPAQFAVAQIKSLSVMTAGEKSTDEYRLTPDELYHLGQKEFAKQNHDAAHVHLSQLHGQWRLDTDKAKNVVQWLFAASLAKQQHGDTVKFFEVLKEKFPDVELSFEDILQVAKSYRELAEYERGYLVYRATVEGSFERESQVAGFLNARGEFVRSVQAMERLLRDYPAESYLATATYALAQETYRRAAKVNEDARLKSAGLTRVHLIDAAVNMLDHFVTAWPQDPANDQASFALATALIDLEQYAAAIQRSEQYAQRYPQSRLLDSFWYMIGYSHFELEHPEEALAMCRKVAETQVNDPASGGTRAADNRWEAIYIMGQIYHSLGQAAKAIDQYAKVKERFADATEAIKFFSRKEIALDEVTTIKPNDAKQLELRFRNVATAAIKIYRIDLMKFGLMQRNLDRITAINLAGIKPYHEETIQLGDGNDFRDRTHSLELPLKEEGAYLIVCSSENLYASGLALVSPLKLLVQEDTGSGRVRVSVKDTSDDSFVNDVHAKVIGSANDDFVSGDTDLRGLFIADDIQGTSTVIAMRQTEESTQYAFFRGEVAMQGVVPKSHKAQPAPADKQKSNAPANVGKPSKGGLRDNLFQMNRGFQAEQKGNYDNLLNNGRTGVKSEEAF